MEKYEYCFYAKVYNFLDSDRVTIRANNIKLAGEILKYNVVHYQDWFKFSRKLLIRNF